MANETWKFVLAKSKQAMKQVLGIKDEAARMKVTPPLAVAPLAHGDDMRWNPNDDGIMYMRTKGKCQHQHARCASALSSCRAAAPAQAFPLTATDCSTAVSPSVKTELSPSPAPPSPPPSLPLLHL